MRKVLALLLTTSFLAAGAATPALADNWHRHGGPDQGRWHGDIHRFHERDFGYWREGNWVHGYHGGRGGWWWVVSGQWYFYPTPVYPYPDPYTPSNVVIETVPSETGGYVYYCPSPAGYYPYIPQCAAPWQRAVSTTVVTAPAPQQVYVEQPAPMESPKDADFRQLNKYADEFHHINAKAPDALAKLKKLNVRFETFRKTLFDRDYNAMGILKDCEDLKARIDAKKAEAAKKR